MHSQFLSFAGKSTLICLGILALVAAVPAQAQIPDEFTNLKVLPESMGKRELISVMRSFSTSLGVRCFHCHVGDSPDSLEGYDFASDEPEAKRVARAMMKMTGEINDKLLPTAGRRSVTRVTCLTCHRGVTNPEDIGSILAEAAEKDGAEAAIERYRALREEHYGSGSYDFGPMPLGELAEKLAQEKNDLDGATAVARLTVELHPDEAYGHLMLGQLLMTKGEAEAAIASVERALKLDPENRWAKQMLGQLKKAE
ncbi:MAG: c-type cytochrome [bacterium]|nr:c-type cytochrome [bacterium]